MTLGEERSNVRPMLRPHEPPPFEIVRPTSQSPVVLICDHASHRIPEALGDLGVSEADRLTHIGWDIGAANVARRLSELLDATLVLTGYSRLVVDCNRPVHVSSAMPEVTGGVTIPGNIGLTAEQRQARVEAFHRPYHEAIARELDRRPTPVMLSIHSFTPQPLYGAERPWPISLLYGRDSCLARLFLEALRADDPSLHVGDNEPYRVSDETDWAIPVHGVKRGILHTAFEIRQDGIESLAGAHAWADRIAQAWSRITVPS